MLISRIAAATGRKPGATVGQFATGFKDMRTFLARSLRTRR